MNDDKIDKHFYAGLPSQNLDRQSSRISLAHDFHYATNN